MDSLPRYALAACMVEAWEGSKAARHTRGAGKAWKGRHRARSDVNATPRAWNLFSVHSFLDNSAARHHHNNDYNDRISTANAIANPLPYSPNRLVASSSRREEERKSVAACLVAAFPVCSRERGDLESRH